MTAGRSDRPVRVGISSCLLGEEVRFDGGHKRDSLLTDTFGLFVEWVPVCPEVECGFGTPRESMRLTRQGTSVRLVTNKSGRDVTDQLDHYALQRVKALDDERLSGYVLKTDSPSCGLEGVKVYGAHAMPARTGRGLFAARLVERFPHLPVEEEGRLSDPRLRDNFAERVFAYARLQPLFAARWTVGSLVAFHTAHKLILMAHSPRAYQQLGVLVAGAKQTSRPDLERQYTDGFMTALRIIATPRRHANVLQHMAGYLKPSIDRDATAELSETIDEFRRGLVPLIVPITLIRHYVRRHDIRYLAGQRYLDPHPGELMLRNHV
jgi:uncharacterized protein YbgA (DUF1722 family)/uncharacterized protein YbbK (DUF523 family)